MYPSFDNLSACGLAAGINMPVLVTHIAVDIAGLNLLDPFVVQRLLYRDTLRRVQVQHAICKFHGAGFQTPKDRMARESTIDAHFIVGMVLPPILKEFDVPLKVRIVVHFGGVPQRPANMMTR